MDRNEMIEMLNGIQNAYRQRKMLYQIADELGVKYQQSNCAKCARDLYNILREELGMIESAADESAFNDVPETGYEWRYVRKAPVYCNGVTYSQSTDPKLIEQFVKKFPKGYYEKVAVEQHIEEITEEENTYSND